MTGLRIAFNVDSLTAFVCKPLYQCHRLTGEDDSHNFICCVYYCYSAYFSSPIHVLVSFC